MVHSHLMLKRCSIKEVFLLYLHQKTHTTMTKEQKEIFVEISTTFTRDLIVSKAMRDGEKPMGFLLTYLRDMYRLPKTQGWAIAEELLNFFNIDNETMGYKFVQ